MPHVIVKMSSGRTDEKKQQVADAVSKAVAASLDLNEESISVAIQDVAASDWLDKVYRPDIEAKMDQIYRMSNYKPR